MGLNERNEEREEGKGDSRATLLGFRGRRTRMPLGVEAAGTRTLFFSLYL